MCHLSLFSIKYFDIFLRASNNFLYIKTSKLFHVLFTATVFLSFRAVLFYSGIVSRSLLFSKIYWFPQPRFPPPPPPPPHSCFLGLPFLLRNHWAKDEQLFFGVRACQAGSSFFLLWTHRSSKLHTNIHALSTSFHGSHALVAMVSWSLPYKPSVF